MEDVFVIRAKPEEIAALVLAVQGQQSRPGCFGLNEREVVQILYGAVKNLSERLATKDGTSTRCQVS